MSSKIPYEISLWDDGLSKQEEKLCILGASEMAFEGRSINNKFITNINGSHTLTFDIPKKYFDYSTGEMVENIIINEIWNESKIKLNFDGKWYEFVVRDIAETRQGKQLYFSYTCVDSFITELSSQGYEIIFDEETGIGNIDELGEKVFKNSTWTYLLSDEKDFKEKIKQYKTNENGEILLDGHDLPIEEEVETQLPITKYEPILDRYVSKYSINGIDNYWGYESTEIITRTSCKNLITNGLNFINTTGWSTENSKVSLTTEKIEKDGDINYVLVCTPIENDIVKNETSFGNKLTIGNRYAIKIIFEGPETLGGQIVNDSLKHFFNVKSGEYKVLKMTDNFDGFETQLNISETTKIISIELFECIAKEINDSNIINGWTNGKLLSEEEQNIILLPDGNDNIPVCYNNAKIYCYQIIDDEIHYVSSEGAQLVYNSGKKIRTLKADKSNRFNLCQDMAELFEGWARFEIDFDNMGRVKYEKEINGEWTDVPYGTPDARPKKYVKFVENVGKENGAGFHYQINLNDIARTKNSEELVTKMFVEHLPAEYSDTGEITIELASKEYNPSQENFLINLDYFIKIGKINALQWVNDLYGTASHHLGYLTNLGKANEIYNEYSDLNIGIHNSISTLTTKKETLELQLTSYQQEIDAQNTIINAELATEKQKTEAKETKARYEKAQENIRINLVTLENQITAYQEEFEANEEKINEALATKERLHKEFNTLYSSYIREGVWQDDNYTSNDAYCIDALKTLRRSCYPEVSYTMKVINISGSEEYKDWTFEVGDYTYATDEEIFGRDNTGMLNREPVTLSIITYDLDNAQDTEITVQNYKTQFEDLFSRIAAAAQTVQFKDGIYTNAANNFTADGEIKVSVLQNTLLNNSITLAAASDQSVLINTDGIELTDVLNASRIVRIINSGIFLSSNGGKSWTTGITGDGINASCITSGYINTSKLAITDLGVPTFIWDDNGITAYKIGYLLENGNESITTYDTQFVRFDQHGLYLTNSNSQAFSDDETGKAWWKGKTWTERMGIIRDTKNAIVSLTWDGLLIGSNSGALELSTQESNLKIRKNNIERIILGEYNELGEIGLIIKNDNGNTVLKTESDGSLWLQDRLSIGGINTNPYAFIAAAGEEITTENDMAVFAAGPIENSEFEVGNRFHYNFSVDAKGRLIARDALIFGNMKIDGDIAANNGIIRKKITVGGNGQWNEDGNWIIDTENSLNWFSGEEREDYAIHFGRKFEDNIVTNSEEVNLIDEGDNEEELVSYKRYFSVSRDGALYARDADIEGKIIATSGEFSGVVYADGGQFRGTILAQNGSILGNISIGNSSEDFIFTLDGTENAQNRILVKNKNKQIFSVDNQGAVYANKITIGNNGQIEEYLMIGDTAALINPIEDNPFSFVVGSSNLNNNLNNKNYNNIETLSNFIIKKDGNLIIRGQNNILYGNLEIPTSAEGTRKITIGNITITADENGGKIYSNINNTDQWRIDDKGNAYFQNAQINGKLQAVQFVYDEVATSSGTILIRPSAKIKEIKEYIENDEFYGYEIILDQKLAEVRKGNYILLQSSKNYNNPSSTKYHAIIDKIGENNQIIIKCLYNIDLSIVEENNFINNRVIDFNPSLGEFNDGIFIDFGGNKDNGITINAMNTSKYGEQQAITFYKNNVKPYTTDLEENVYERVPVLVLGNLSGMGEVQSYFPEGKDYGLYADNAYLKGIMLAVGEDKNGYKHTSGITTPNSVDGSDVVLWANALNDIRGEATFRVTTDGALYAEKGIFKGSIDTADAKISGRLMNDGLLVDGHSKGIAFLAEDSDIKDIDNISTIIKQDGINLLSGADLKIYKENYTEEDFQNSENIKTNPYLYSDDYSESLVINTLSTYDLIENDGLFINKNSIGIKNRNENVSSDYLSAYKNLWSNSDLISLNFSRNGYIEVSASIDDDMNTKLYKNKIVSYDSEIKNSAKIDQQIELGEKAIFKQHINGFDIQIIE